MAVKFTALYGEIPNGSVSFESLDSELQEKHNELFNTIEGSNILPPNAEFIEGYAIENWGVGKNKLNSIYAVEGKYCSPIIECKGNTNYVLLNSDGSAINANAIGLYDKDGIALQFLSGTSHFTTTEDTKYIRTTMGSNSLVSIQLYENKNSGYIISHYGKKIEKLFVDKKEFNNEKKETNNIRTFYYDEQNTRLEDKGEVLYVFDKIGSISSGEFVLTRDTRYSVSSLKATGASDYYSISYDCNLECSNGEILQLWFKAFQKDLRNVNRVSAVLYDKDNNVIINTSRYGDTAKGIKNGWNLLQLKFTSDSVITKIKLIVSKNTSNESNVIFDSITKGYRLRPTILFCFDNATKNLYENAYLLFKNRNMPFTSMLVDFSDEGGISTNLTRAMADEMFNNGWEYAIYAFDKWGEIVGTNTTNWEEYITNNENYTTIYNGIKSLKEKLANIGYPEPSAYFCRTNSISDVLFKAVKNNGINTIRCKCSGDNVNYNFDKESKLVTTINMSDTNINQIKSLIDKTIEDGCILCLFSHEILETNSNENHISISALTEILDYAKQYIDNNQLDCITFKDLLNDTSNKSGISEVDFKRLQIKVNNL